MSSIFISYRRGDTAGHAGRIFDHLAAHFGADQVFRDVDQIAPGTNFVQALDRTLASCTVAVVVIGRDWLDARNDRGERRLDDAGDWVRIEVATTLRRGIRVVPVLVEGAAMPARRKLPADLALLADLQAVEITDSRWDYDTGRLIQALEGTSGLAARPERRRPRLLPQFAASILIGMVCAIAFGYFVFYPPNTPPDYVYAIIFFVFTGLAYFAIGVASRRWRRG